MKKTINKSFKIISIAIFFYACNTSNEKNEIQTRNEELIIEESEENYIKKIDSINIANVPQTFDSSSILGYYVGNFEAKEYKDDKKPMYINKINICIDSIIKDSVYGHTIVAGNTNLLKGSILFQTKNFLQIDATEIITNKYSGKFSFELTINDKTITGQWIANDTSIAVTVREYTLHKKTFEYNPNQEIGNDFYGELYNSYNAKKNKTEAITEDANKYNASIILLTSKQIENMYKRDLEIMRNAIYARHGYSFKNRVIRTFFDSEIDWYMPISTNVTAQLTEIEKKNIVLIKSYEDHAAAYYDSFGR